VIGRSPLPPRSDGRIIRRVPPLDPDDAYIARALARAAEWAAPNPGDKSFLERRLAEAVAASLADGFFDPDLVVCDKKLMNSELPGWDPQPGTIDVAVVTRRREPRIVFELKRDDVEWTLWDIYKMVAAAELPTVEAAYIVVAGKPKLWASQRECVELFDLDYDAEEQVDSVEWYSRFLFSHYRKAFQELLEGGRGRLTRVPYSIWISAVGRWPLPNFQDYELRAVRVWGAEREDEPIEFANDWPRPPIRKQQDDNRSGWPKLIPTEELQPEDVPSADAEEDALHRFALSFNGYEENGSFRRCARIANEALARWRETEELPEDLDDLRTSLFFEQRRWHHFGYGFDEVTMTYVRALVAKVFTILTHRSSAS
jgi:hypothetical protein